MRKIKLLALLAAAMFATSMWATPAAVDATSGLSWEFNYVTYDDLTRGTLTITYDGAGTGIMPNYLASVSSTCPWKAYRTKIISISLPEGLTAIGNAAFWECSHEEVTELSFPSTVTSIGGYSAIDISHLQTLTCLPTTAPTLGTLGNGAISSNADNFEIIYPAEVELLM